MTETIVKKKNGRPTKYKSEYADIAYKLCLLNYDDKQLANAFSVNESTINAWKNKHPKFSKSLKAGKEIADAKVAASLYERATGYSHPEDKFFHNAKTGKVVKVATTKHYPPDTAAAFIWLKNRAGWRDDSNVNINDNRLTKEEIASIRAKLEAKYIESSPVDRPGD